MKDVVSVQTAQLEIEQVKEKRYTKIRKKSEEEKNELDSTITNAEERRNGKPMKRY